MKKILMLLAAAALLASCASGPKSKLESLPAGAKADMSAYATYDADTDYVFVESSIREMYERTRRKESFVIFFGFAGCPWCRDFMPVMNEAARKSGCDTVFYANSRENPAWKSNLDMDDYDLLVQMAYNYLPLDENNIRHLDAPTAYFVKNGKIRKAVGSLSYDAIHETIPASEREKLLKELLAGFKAIR